MISILIWSCVVITCSSLIEEVSPQYQGGGTPKGGSWYETSRYGGSTYQPPQNSEYKQQPYKPDDNLHYDAYRKPYAGGGDSYGSGQGQGPYETPESGTPGFISYGYKVKRYDSEKYSPEYIYNTKRYPHSDQKTPEPTHQGGETPLAPLFTFQTLAPPRDPFCLMPSFGEQDVGCSFPNVTRFTFNRATLACEEMPFGSGCLNVDNAFSTLALCEQLCFAQCGEFAQTECAFNPFPVTGKGLSYDLSNNECKEVEYILGCPGEGILFPQKSTCIEGCVHG